MPEVLLDDLTACELWVRSLHGAVLSAAVASFFQVVFFTLVTLPEHKSRGQLRIPIQLLVLWHEVTEEVESSIVAGSVPEIVLYLVVRLRHLEGSHSDGVLFLRGFTRIQVLEDFLSIVLGDEHGGDTDASAGSIV